MASITPIFLNNITATLGSVAAAGTTSFTVGAGEGARFAGIGTNQYIPAIVVDTTTSPETVIEYVNVTARSTDTLTVERAVQDATTYPAAAIASGKTLAAVAPARELGDSWKTGGGDIYRTGYYSTGMFNSASYGTLALTLSRLYARPFWVPVRRSFDRIGVQVTTAATGGSGGVIRMGIYGPGGGVPGALILDAGTVGSETTGGKEIVISQALEPGIYWLAIVAQTATCTVTSMSATTESPWVSITTSPIASAGAMTHAMNSVTGALGAFTPSGASNQIPVVSLRAA